MRRSVRVADLQADVGDIIELASGSSDDADGADVPLALLQAIWQTKKGKHCASKALAAVCKHMPDVPALPGHVLRRISAALLQLATKTDDLLQQSVVN